MKINKIVRDISKNLNNETRFETNQETQGIRNVFRRIVIKIWTGNNFETSEDITMQQNHCERISIILQRVLGR